MNETEKIILRLAETYKEPSEFMQREAPSDKEIIDRHVTNNRHIDFERFNFEKILNLWLKVSAQMTDS